MAPRARRVRLVAPALDGAAGQAARRAPRRGTGAARLAAPSPATRVLGVPRRRCTAPSSGSLLLFVLRWSLPLATQEILEVRVIAVLMHVDLRRGASSSTRSTRSPARRDATGRSRGEPDSAALRLRSLRLVARVVVIFGLILVISSMLVGRGTIYQWVFSTCWLASIPMLLVLVRWWRSIVFRRTERLRKTGRVQRWVLANSEGWWTSFAAAAVGALFLFGSGAAAWGAQLDRPLRHHPPRARLSVPASARQARAKRAPSGPSRTRPSSRSARRSRRRAGSRPTRSVSACEARGPHPREEGRSRRHRRRARNGQERRSSPPPRTSDDAHLGRGPLVRSDSLRARFAESVGLAPGDELRRKRGRSSSPPDAPRLLLDDAHRFVQPVMGGLATFDTLLATASRHAPRRRGSSRSTGSSGSSSSARGSASPLRRSDPPRALARRADRAPPARPHRRGGAFAELREPARRHATDGGRGGRAGSARAARGRLLSSALGRRRRQPRGRAPHVASFAGHGRDGETVVRPSTALDTATSSASRIRASSCSAPCSSSRPARAEQIAKGTLLRRDRRRRRPPIRRLARVHRGARGWVPSHLDMVSRHHALSPTQSTFLIAR